MSKSPISRSSVKHHAVKEIMKWLTGSDDPYEINVGLPWRLAWVGSIRGLNGPEAAADEVVSQFREAGVEAPDYTALTSEIEALVRGGINVWEAVGRVYERALDRARTAPDTAAPRQGATPRDGRVPPSPGMPASGPRSDAGEAAPNFRTAGARDLHAAIAGDRVPDPEEILLKRPADLTEAEARALGRRRAALPMGHPDAARLFAAEAAFYAHAYGDDPQARDETGRPLPPTPQSPLPATSRPLRTPDGEPLPAALARIADRAAGDADKRGAAETVRTLQRHLNHLAVPAAGSSESFERPLVEDGVFGPQTRERLTRTLVARGAGSVDPVFSKRSVGSPAPFSGLFGGDGIAAR